ncbi:uncharacterized protein I206_100645 [Kwoniella pini CBS 10737]|uniref:Uncharacterized protein n=1 Tax=Kwoniella pini CBS 10737 TaxID=1296096 RepID=A0A1B9ICK6_9TREE|nr:uncharacterized protein I206_00680 [Kwoniella pini CBS 10737]OCF53378.1 hypothetical protein I206_00680 [Kwoniella pini CBS 10737]
MITSRQDSNNNPPSYDQIQKYTTPRDPSPIERRPSDLPSENEISKQVTQSFYNSEIDSRGLIENERKCINPWGHSPKTVYGTMGIVAGVLFFPWGLFW